MKVAQINIIEMVFFSVQLYLLCLSVELFSDDIFNIYFSAAGFFFNTCISYIVINVKKYLFTWLN